MAINQFYPFCIACLFENDTDCTVKSQFIVVQLIDGRG